MNAINSKVQPFFSSTVVIIRTIAYLVLFVLNVAVLASVGSWLGNDTNRTISEPMMAGTSLPLIFAAISAFFTLLLLCGRPRLSYELALMSLVQILTLAAFANYLIEWRNFWYCKGPIETNWNQNPDFLHQRDAFCSNMRKHYVPVYVNFAWTVSCFIGLLIFGLVHVREGGKKVYVIPVSELGPAPKHASAV